MGFLGPMRHRYHACAADYAQKASPAACRHIPNHWGALSFARLSAAALSCCDELLQHVVEGSKGLCLAADAKTLVIVERMETHPFDLRGPWEKELEAVLLDDLEFVWGPRIRLSR